MFNFKNNFNLLNINFYASIITLVFLALFAFFQNQLFAQEADTSDDKAQTHQATSQASTKSEPETKKTATSSKPMVFAQDPQKIFDALEVFKLGNKVVTMKALREKFPAQVYEFEKKIHSEISNLAMESYLDSFFIKLAEKESKTVDQAKKDYFAKHASVKKHQLEEILERMKSHPQTKNLSLDEQKKQAHSYVKRNNEMEVNSKIISQGMASNDLKITWQEPKEPAYELAVHDDDHVRYGAGYGDIKPIKCAKEDCEITIIEFSEYQCPFCARVIPTSKKLLKAYKGRIRWVMKDLPLDFHDRAKPAAIAAGCAGEQGKFWHMYHKLYENQSELDDADFVKYAKEFKIYNRKFKECIAKPDKQLMRINRSMAEASKLNVNGTPAFFINGKRISGAVPYERFKEIIDKEVGS